MASVDEFMRQWLDDKPHIEAHTSGSTGVPKLVRLNKDDMLTSARATNRFFGIDDDSCLASPLSVDYIAGKMMVVRAIEAGCRLVHLPISNEIVLPADSSMIDLLPIVPSQIRSLICQPNMASRIRNVLIGGASPSAADCLLLSQMGYNVYISYGMTETCSHVALAKGEDTERIFHAMPGISFSTTDDGRLIVEAPEFTFKRLVTNDIVELQTSTSMQWRGRADGVINSGGIKMYPEELEMLYSTALYGRNYYVAGVDDDKWGRAVALFIEGSEDEKCAIAEAVSQCVGDRRKLPKYIITVENLPRTSSGKIKRSDTPNK